jgi:hypothetical protein
VRAPVTDHAVAVVAAAHPAGAVVVLPRMHAVERVGRLGRGAEPAFPIAYFLGRLRFSREPIILLGWRVYRSTEGMKPAQFAAMREVAAY